MAPSGWQDHYGAPDSNPSMKFTHPTQKNSVFLGLHCELWPFTSNCIPKEMLFLLLPNEETAIKYYIIIFCDVLKFFSGYKDKYNERSKLLFKWVFGELKKKKRMVLLECGCSTGECIINAVGNQFIIWYETKHTRKQYWLPSLPHGHWKMMWLLKYILWFFSREKKCFVLILFLNCGFFRWARGT